MSFYGPCSACGDGDTDLKFHSHDKRPENSFKESKPAPIKDSNHLPESPCRNCGVRNESSVIKNGGLCNDCFRNTCTKSYLVEHIKGSREDCSVCYVPNKVETKQTNPKDIIGSDKVPLGLVPAVTIAYAALGHLEGNLKYGLVNWREAGVRTSIYIDACLRHIEKFKEGEWEDPQTKVPHLANALACLSIIIDAYHAGKLNDDRPKSTKASEVIDKLSDVVKHLKQLHGDMKPVDYFIDGPKKRK